MALPSSMFEADWDLIAGDIVQEITFDGETYTAIVSDPGRGENAEMFGMMGADSVEVHIKQEDFDTMPGIGDKLTFESVNYRVDRMADDVTGVGRRLYCVAEYEGG